MKIRALICVLLLGISAMSAAGQTPAFEKARRLGEGKQRSFFLFSTSTAKYTIRHDGMGEISANSMHLIFHLKVSGSGRVEQIYFHEYHGDLLLLYEVSDGQGGTGYLTRLNPQTRKKRWVTALDVNKIGPCSIAGDAVTCGPTDDSTTIELKTGAEIKTTSSQSSSSCLSPTRGSASSRLGREHRKAA
jgi:hypothetical protein